ncbi:MAG: hypothetical protein M0P63_00190 [Azoarcus sp.]|nr:hypothetical protein [Azoarcus sp.]
MNNQIKQDAEVRSALSSLLVEINSAISRPLRNETLSRIKSLIDDFDRLIASKQANQYKEEIQNRNLSNDELLAIACNLKLELVLINRRLSPMKKRIQEYKQMEIAIIKGKSIEDVADRLDSTSYRQAEAMAEKLFSLKIHAESEAKTKSAKHSLSQRKDMKEHEPFKAFCRQLLKKGIKIEKLKHITSAEGYDKKFDKISDRKRREIARSLGIVFTAGADKKG